jgi:hypothetical protein
MAEEPFKNRVILVVAGTTRFTRQLARYEFSVSQP